VAITGRFVLVLMGLRGRGQTAAQCPCVLGLVSARVAIAGFLISQGRPGYPYGCSCFPDSWMISASLRSTRATVERLAFMPAATDASAWD